MTHCNTAFSTLNSFIEIERAATGFHRLKLSRAMPDPARENRVPIHSICHCGFLMLSEFSLIERFFERPPGALKSPETALNGGKPRAALGIGDDCALLDARPGQQLAISTDMLVEGRHFFADVAPYALGHKALAVNLSDLAAMGAEPRAFTLALGLPRAEEAWLESFSQGLLDTARRFDCELIGGDTTRSPIITLCITVFGDVPPAQALRRDAACPGDDIWVSGVLGDARAGLAIKLGEWTAVDADAERRLVRALELPEPRVALGMALRGVAHAALDLSDGLAGDLLRILKRSKMRASVNIDDVPRSAEVAALQQQIQQQYMLAGGDDYELCFTAATAERPKIERIGQRLGVLLTRIGTIEGPAPSGHAPERAPEHAPADPPEPAPAIRWRDAAGQAVSLTLQGFDHFHAD
jgi:thiamine-monophosphate kinase